MDFPLIAKLKSWYADNISIILPIYRYRKFLTPNIPTEGGGGGGDENKEYLGLSCIIYSCITVVKCQYILYRHENVYDIYSLSTHFVDIFHFLTRLF